jgi:hypothetical protein
VYSSTVALPKGGKKFETKANEFARLLTNAALKVRRKLWEKPLTIFSPAVTTNSAN